MEGEIAYLVLLQEWKFRECVKVTEAQSLPEYYDGPSHGAGWDWAGLSHGEDGCFYMEAVHKPLVQDLETGLHTWGGRLR